MMGITVLFEALLGIAVLQKFSCRYLFHPIELRLKQSDKKIEK